MGCRWINKKSVLSILTYCTKIIFYLFMKWWSKQWDFMDLWSNEWSSRAYRWQSISPERMSMVTGIQFWPYPQCSSPATILCCWKYLLNLKLFELNIQTTSPWSTNRPALRTFFNLLIICYYCYMLAKIHIIYLLILIVKFKKWRALQIYAQ